MKRRFWGSIAGAGIALACLLTACGGGITTSEPIDMNRDGTAPTTAATGTTGNTKDTTGATGSTAPFKKEYAPDPVMTFEEYMSELREPEDEEKAWDYRFDRKSRVFVYRSGMLMDKIFGAPSTLHDGSIYWWDNDGDREENFRLLRDERAACYTEREFEHMGYTYVAVDGTIYRYKNDGTDETLIFESHLPIKDIAGDSYALFFTTDEGLYRLFRPTGQLDRLCDLGSNSPSLWVYTNDVVLASTSNGGYFYIASLNRVVEEKSVMEAYGGRQIVEKKSFCRWLYTYCESHPE